ncbi:MAG: ATP-binding protein, partial [Janthinobacterium lividum]
AVLAQWLEGAEGVTAAELHEDLPAMAPLQRDAHSDAGSSQDGTATLPGPAQALGHAGLLALARAYEHSVAHADRLIEALARDLQRAEQLQALDHALQILATDRASLVGEKEQLARAEQQRQDEWLALLAAAGLPAVMPQGLRAWQSALSQARSQCEQRALLGEELASADAAALELGRVLQAAIAAIHGNAVASTLPLHQLAALADELEAELKQRETRYNNAIGKQQARQQQQQLAAAREQELALRASQAQLAMANLLPLLQLDSADGLESARARLLQFDTLLLARDRRDQALTLAARAQAALSVLQQQAQSLAMCLGDQGDLPVPALRLYVEQLAARLAKARKIQSAHALAAHALELAQQTVERETALAQAHESMLAQLCRNAGVAHPSMLPEAELRARRKQDALADVERTQRQLQQASRRTETHLRDLLRNHDAVRLDADEALLNQEREALEDRLRQARTLEEQSRHALAAVDSGDEAVVFQQGMERASAHVRGALAPWMRTRLAHGLLAEAQKRFRERAQGPMLSSASAFFCNMTAAEFTGLASDESREGVAPVLLAMRRDGRPVRVEQLSEGTRDQLYLALRLAALDLRRQAGVDMPLVLDDVLMTSDDRRAALMLQTLAGFSRHGQVIVFTHHAHLIDVARRAVASDVLSVVEL